MGVFRRYTVLTIMVNTPLRDEVGFFRWASHLHPGIFVPGHALTYALAKNLSE